jgi:hypothetical protein
MALTFEQLFARRQQLETLRQQNDQAIDAARSQGDWQEIEDLQDPHGKRLLFDDLVGVAEESTSTVEAIPGSSLTPSRGNQTQRACVGVCAFGRACERACAMCERQCVRIWGAHECLWAP